MLEKVSATLGAILLLLLHFVAWSAQVGLDNGDLITEQEGAQPDLFLLQLGAHATARDEIRQAAGNSSSEDSTDQVVVGLQGQLASMQREMDEQRRLFQQLQADRAKSSPRQNSSSARAPRTRKKHNRTSRLQEESQPPNWDGDRMNLLPTQFPAERPTAAPPTSSWVEPIHEDHISNWPIPVTQKEWLKSMAPTNPELVRHFKEIAEEIQEAKIVSCVIIFTMLVFVMAHIMQDNEVHFLPEGAMVILVGYALGYVLKYYCESRVMYDTEYRSEIAIQLLNEIFLPMLMLEAGWGVRRMDFISQLPYILNFAILGTLISTTVIGVLIYTTGQAGLHSIESLRGALVIAALISATDPVATLGTYSELKVDPLLNILVFGEAAINDAVAIVVFSLVNNDYIMATYETTTGMVAYGIYRGVKTLTCSFLLGALVSGAICIILKTVQLRRNKKLEILVVVLGGYLSFAVGEYFRVSGIICTLFNGMVMGKYAKYHLSKEGSMLTTFYIKQLSTLMDAGVFLLSGVCCVCLDLESSDLGLWLILFCCVARICSTIPCGLLSNWMKRHFKSDPQATEADMHILTSKYLFMIWHAGLRGGIAENLALQIGPWLDEIDGVGSKANVRSSVFLLVGFFVIVFGGTTKMFLNILGIPTGVDNPEDVLSKTELVHSEARMINWMHSKIFYPLLVGGDADEQNADIVQGIDDEDILEVLHDVCHNHRGIAAPKKPEPAMKSVVRRVMGLRPKSQKP